MAQDQRKMQFSESKVVPVLAGLLTLMLLGGLACLGVWAGWRYVSGAEVAAAPTPSPTAPEVASAAVETEPARSAVPAADEHPLPTVEGEQPCAACHPDTAAEAQKPYLHAPFAQGNCQSCHAPHDSPNAFQLVMPADQLCFTCHPRSDDLAKAVKHQPFAAGQCLSCHQPHGAEQKGLLRREWNDLCWDCHPGVAEERQMENHHPPFDSWCGLCHEPHASNNEVLMTRPQPTICVGCHGYVGDEFKQPSHHPVPEGKLTCTGCHGQHASPAGTEHLLRKAGRSLCYMCHGDKQELYEKTGHAAAAKLGDRPVGDCLNCHQAHGAPYSFNLVRPRMALCQTCHGKGGHFDHPMGGETWDSWHEQTLVCDSCHNPHGTPYAHLTWTGGDALCVKCHTNLFKR